MGKAKPQKTEKDSEVKVKEDQIEPAKFNPYLVAFFLFVLVGSAISLIFGGGK